MKKTKLVVAIGLLATAPLSNSGSFGTDTLLEGWSQSASVALTSEYVWRGVSQTAEDAAIQGQFDLSHDSGFYVGVWASNVEFRDGSKNNIEIDGYVGFSNEIDLGGLGVTYDLGYLHYQFPSSSAANIDEFYIGLAISPIKDLNLSAYYYHDLGIENKFANYYTDISTDYTLPDWLFNVTVLGHLGHYGRQAGDSDYWDWKLALAKDIGVFNFEVAYIDTDLNTPAAAERLVVTVSRELGGNSAAQDMLPDGFTSSASVALTTDYVWRGISQTQNDAAIQGQFDVAHESGLYLGVWGSNVEFGGPESLELDAYFGFANEIDLAGTAVTYDIGWLHYEYPSNDTLSFNEIYFGLGVSPIDDLDLGIYYYQDPGVENKIANYYVDITADYSLPEWAFGTQLVTHLGHYDRQDSATDYWDWKIGLAKDFGDFNFEIAYTDSGDSDAKDDGDARAVATVSASF